MFQTFALIVRVSGEALRQNMSQFGDCSKPGAGKSFGHYVWQLILPFLPPSFPTGVEMFVVLGPGIGHT